MEALGKGVIKEYGRAVLLEFREDDHYLLVQRDVSNHQVWVE